MKSEKAVGITVAAVGCLLVVSLAGILLLSCLWIRASQMEAAKQRAIAEAEHERAKAQKVAAEERLHVVQQKLDMVREQLDQTRKTWDYAATRRDGRLTAADRDTIDRGFNELHERLRELDGVFHERRTFGVRAHRKYNQRT
jgi:Flp pilus assembly protein TadB